MWRDEYAFAAIPLLAHRVPKVFPGGGVEAGSGLVQEQYTRVADHSYGSAELSLVAATNTHTHTHTHKL